MVGLTVILQNSETPVKCGLISVQSRRSSQVRCSSPPLLFPRLPRSYSLFLDHSPCHSRFSTHQLTDLLITAAHKTVGSSRMIASFHNLAFANAASSHDLVELEFKGDWFDRCILFKPSFLLSSGPSLPSVVRDLYTSADPPYLRPTRSTDPQ